MRDAQSFTPCSEGEEVSFLYEVRSDVFYKTESKFLALKEVFQIR